MSRILAMFRVSVLQTVRDRGELFSLIVLPMLLTFMFSAAFGNAEETAVRVLLVDGDRTPLSRKVGTLLSAEEGFSVETVGLTSATTRIEAGEADAAVIVPEGFGHAVESAENAELQTLENPGSTSAYAVRLVTQGIAERFSADVAAARIARQIYDRTRRGASEIPPHAVYPGLRSLAPSATIVGDAEADWSPAPVSVRGEAVAASDVRSDTETAAASTQYSMGIAVMFVLFVTVGGSAGMLEERELGTLVRLLVTPTRRPTLLLGKIASVFGLAVIESSILIGFGALALGVPWGNDPLALLAVLVPYLLAATGLGVLISALVRSRAQLSGVTPLVATGLAMLGGCYWQLEIMPPFMQTVAKLTPTGWAMIGFTDIVARNQGLSAAALPAAVLLVMAAIFFGIGVWRLRFE